MKLSLLMIALLLAACGTDDQPTATECPPGQTANPVTGECLRNQVGPNNVNNTANNDNNENNANNANNANNLNNNTSDMGMVEDLGPDVGCEDDNDGDGQVSIACGGLDCDDTTGVIFDGAPETCDEYDNNCDNQINEGLDCSFYAHSDTRLYRVNPFELTLTDIGAVPTLFDIDTHPDGTLYGITSTRLHTFNGTGWDPAPQTLGLAIDDFANGMAIDNAGTIYITTKDTLSTVNITTGVSTEVGDIGPSSSSGDCVVNKGNQLFMTSDHLSPDAFVTLDGNTGTPTTVGQTGSVDIWALTAAWGRMYGLTGDGRLIQINETDGTSVELHQFPSVEFYGAASTPSR